MQILDIVPLTDGDFDSLPITLGINAIVSSYLASVALMSGFRIDER